MRRIDVRGEVCPRPALIVRDELDGLEPGETLAVEGDYPPAEENLTRTCTNHGYDVVTVESGDDFELRITAPDP